MLLNKAILLKQSPKSEDFGDCFSFYFKIKQFLRVNFQPFS